MVVSFLKLFLLLDKFDIRLYAFKVQPGFVLGSDLVMISWLFSNELFIVKKNVDNF